MSKISKAMDTLDEYFKEKGSILSALDYQRQTDTPIRYRVVLNIFSSWPRMEKLIMARRLEVIVENDVDDVLARRNAASAKTADMWKKASEDQKTKAEKEAKAQAVAEVLTHNARTPEGANANKVAIGGPLLKEQPLLELGGATVNVDPATGERKVVDTQPELAHVLGDEEVEGVGSTPFELKEKMKVQATAGGTTDEVAKDDADHGTDTAGGTDGSASISTVAALGNATTETK